MTIEEFRAIDWPPTIIVEYLDGRSETLLRGEGYTLSLPEDDPGGRGSLIGDLPKKHPRNQKMLGRACYFDELRQIRDENGMVLWESTSNAA